MTTALIQSRSKASSKPEDTALKTEVVATSTQNICKILGITYKKNISGPIRLTISPQQASELLLSNVNNRKLNERGVNDLVDQLRNSRFRFNGDCIRFDQNGILLDGQHRLEACVRSQIGFETLVMLNLDSEALPTIDVGRKRTAADHLTLRGEKHASSLSSGYHWLDDLSRGGDTRLPSAATTIINFLNYYPDFRMSTDAAVSSRAGSPMPIGLTVALHFIATYALKEPDRISHFLEVLKSGVPNYAGDPCQMFRERVVKNRLAGQPISRTHYMQGITYAWNKFRRHESIKIFRPTGEIKIDGYDPKVFGF